MAEDQVDQSGALDVVPAQSVLEDPPAVLSDQVGTGIGAADGGGIRGDAIVLRLGDSHRVARLPLTRDRLPNEVEIPQGGQAEEMRGQSRGPIEGPPLSGFDGECPRVQRVFRRAKSCSQEMSPSPPRGSSGRTVARRDAAMADVSAYRDEIAHREGLVLNRGGALVLLRAERCLDLEQTGLRAVRGSSVRRPRVRSLSRRNLRLVCDELDSLVASTHNYLNQWAKRGNAGGASAPWQLQILLG